MYQEFQSKEELHDYVAIDKNVSGEKGFVANRYPIRFVLFDNFRDSFEFISFLQSNNHCIVKSVEDWLDLKYPDILLTYSTLIKHIQEYISQSNINDIVIAPFSELARFYDNTNAKEFDTIIRTIKAIETSKEGFDKKQRIYIPIVGLEGKMSMFANDSQINAWYLKNTDRQNNHRLILTESTYDINFLEEKYSIVNNISEWMRIWKLQDAKPNIISTSSSLFSNAQYAQPDNAFDFCTCNNVYEFLSKGLGLNFGDTKYKPQDEQHWLRLAREIDYRHFSFDDFFNKYFNIGELSDYEVFLKTWFGCKNDFEKWMLCTYYVEKFCNLGYICQVINKLNDYNDVTLFSNIIMLIFDLEENTRNTYLTERNICLEYAKTKNIRLSNDTQDELVQSINKVKNSVGYIMALDYISAFTEAEKILILEWLSQEKISLNAIKEKFPDIYEFFNPINISLDDNKTWIKDYMKIYSECKLCNKYSEEMEKYIAECNGKSLSFNKWYQNIKTTKTELINRQDIDVFYWIDGLGIEWIPYIQYLIGKENGLYLNEIIISKSNLPTVTSINKVQLDALSQNLHKIGDLDFLAHSNRIFPNYILEDIEVVSKAIKQIISEYAGKKIAIVSDHGLTALSQFQNGLKLAGITQHHYGRYAERTSNSTTTDDNYFILDDKKTLCALNHKSLGNKIPDGMYAHGGCTPEEVLVPIFIISSSKNDTNYSCSLITKEISNVNPALQFEIKGLSSVDIPFVEYNGKKYNLTKSTGNTYTCELIAFEGNVADVSLKINSYSFEAKVKIVKAAEEEDIFNF